MMPSEVGSLFTPSDSDWVVTLVTKTGASVTRRISPGTMDEPRALRVALGASSMTGNEIDTWTIRRAGDRSIVRDEVDSFLDALRRRA